MAGKKKKWYQTGEFEDGYQFGDIFRTIKNTVNTNKDTSKTSEGKIKSASNDKKEARTKKSNDTNLVLGRVENGRLSLDPVAQLYGYSSEAERQNYIKENPNLYTVMGGYKYEPSVLSKNYIPLNSEGKRIVQEAIKADEQLKNGKTLDDKTTDLLVKSAKQKSFVGENSTVAEFGAVKSTNTPLVNPKNRSEAYNLFKSEQLKNTTQEYNALTYNDDFVKVVNKAKKIDIDNSNITDKGTYKNIKSGSDIYQYMETNEKDVYYYLVGKGDNAEIRNYILYIKPFLEKRKAEDVAEKTKPVPVGNFGDIVTNVENFRKRTASSAISGVSGALMNMARGGVTSSWNRGLINGANPLMDILDATYVEKLYSSISANAYDENFVYGLWLDIVNNTAAQIPEIAMGATGGQGAYIAGVFTRSLGANTTQAILNGQEYDKGVLHSIVDTGLELLPDMLTGTGITSIFGDGLSNYATKAIKCCDEVFDDPKVAKAVSKSLISTGDNIAEGGQEFAQRLLDPMVRNIIYGEANNVDEETFKDALKGFVIGFFSSAPMSAVSVNNKYSNSRLQSVGADLKNEAAIKSVIQLARLTETFTNEYTEVVRAYETGSAEEIDTVTLGRLYVDAANEFVSPNENRLRNIGLKAVKKIIKKAKEYETSNAGYRLNTVRDLIKGRAVELGADELGANKIADNITGKEIVNENIFNGEISKQIITELQQRENKQAEWVKRVNAVLQSVTKNTAQQESRFANQTVSSDKGRQEGYNNYIDEDAFVEGLWEDSPNSSKNNVENSQLESVENIDENGIIEEAKVLTLNDLKKDVLKTKPPHSRVPKDWIEAGGSIAIDDNGNWIYTDWFGVSIKYINGYPDYRGAGVVFQVVNIGEFRNRTSDSRKADRLAPNGPCKEGHVWHHSQDGCTMEEISREIHERFTHKGGYSLRKRKE